MPGIASGVAKIPNKRTPFLLLGVDPMAQEIMDILENH